MFVFNKGPLIIVLRCKARIFGLCNFFFHVCGNNIEVVVTSARFHVLDESFSINK